MIVQINGKSYAFRFKHVAATKSKVQLHSGIHTEFELTPRATVCEAVVGIPSNMNNEPGSAVLATATAKLSSGDNYCKNTGRKIALARCLATLKISKEQRHEVWEKYFAMRGGKK